MRAALDLAERPDLALQALAQLPDRVRLDLTAAPELLPRLTLLARAYGIGDRVDMAPGEGAARFGEHGAPPAASTMAELVGALREPGDDHAAWPRGEGEFAGQRVVLVTNRPTHYRAPLLNRIARRLSDGGGSLTVLFTDDLSGGKAFMRPERLDFEHLGLTTPGPLARLGTVPVDLQRRLRDFGATLVLVGGLAPAVAGQIALGAQRRGVPFGVWNGEIDTRATAQSRLRRAQRRWILRRATFAISYGYRSGEYLRQVAPALPVVYGRNTTPFPSPASRAPSDTVEVLTVGRALPLKRLDVLVDAFTRLRDHPCRLTIVGDGPALPALREQARGAPNVRFLGAVASDAVAEAYAAADVFLFPSRDDVFGLVLVEAMGAGLATIVSSRPGAVADLVVPGASGIVVEGHEPRAWADAIAALVDDPERRRALGAAARETILGRWTLDHAADAMVAGLRLGLLAGA